MKPTVGKHGPKPNQKADKFESNKCRLKSTFQPHLLKASEEGTNIGRISNHHGSDETFSSKPDLSNECKNCNKKFQSIHGLHFHLASCKKPYKPVKANKPTYTCEKGGCVFQKSSNLAEHSVKCEKKKHICCQLCPRKCFDMPSMQNHLIDSHNLICRPVKEPDFEQALNGTPYTLERAKVFHTLEDVSSLPNNDYGRPDIGNQKNPHKTKKKRSKTKNRRKFIRQKRLDKHIMNDK